jgi:hypothetical protein
MQWGACPGHGLAQLKVLGIHDVPRALPEAFTQLTALRSLSLLGGSITALPEHFGKLAALQTLRMVLCQQLSSLPGSFAQLAALQTLDLRGCGSLTALPDLHGGLGALCKLNIWGCTSLVAVPAFDEHPRLQITCGTQHLAAAVGEGRVGHALNTTFVCCAITRMIVTQRGAASLALLDAKSGACCPSW